MDSFTHIYCSQHEEQVIAKCKKCKEWLCIQCSFSHQQNGHPVLKISALCSEWIQKLKIWIVEIQQELQTIKNYSQQSKAQKGMQIIELCKQQVIELIEHHFQQLKQQYMSIFQSNEAISPQKQLFGFMKAKISEYTNMLTKIQISSDIVFSLQENTIENQNELMKQFLKTKQILCEQYMKNQFQLTFNQQSLSHIADLLSQTIGINFKKTSKQQVHQKSVVKVKDNSVIYFLQKTPYLFIYDTEQKKAHQINLPDFLVPVKAKSCLSSSGKILLVGGESGQDQNTKYHRQIWQFDKKFNMMKILVLMKMGRCFHSVTLASLGNQQQHLFVLGGKNKQKLSSMQKINLNNGTTSLMKQFKTPLAGQTGVQIKDNIFYFGGIVGQNINEKILVYSISKNQWKDYFPLNPANYVPIFEPIVIRIYSHIAVLGGWKSFGDSGYVTNYFQYYDQDMNIFKISNFLLPAGVFRPSTSNYCNGIHQITCQSKRDSVGYGPNIPVILSIDSAMSRVKLNNFMQC